MPRGGKRPGAGRRLGSREKKTIEEEAASANESVLNFLLRKMRDPRVRPEQRVRMALAAAALQARAEPGAEPARGRARR
jgi:hypothetical protein